MQVPDTPYKFYVFSLSQRELGQNAGRLYYSVVDMTLIGGNGDVEPGRKTILLDTGLKVRTMVLPDVFLDQDSPAAMIATAGLDPRGIVAKVFEALGKSAAVEPGKLA